MVNYNSPDKFDPLFDEVASWVVEKQEVSESLIQEHFGIGFNRAYKIMWQLERTGIIGGNFGYVLPRKIYVQDMAHLHSKLEQIHSGIYEPANEDEQREKYREIKLQREKQEIAAKIKEKYRRRELEKLVQQELIDSGELFGDQPKREPIPCEYDKLNKE